MSETKKIILDRQAIAENFTFTGDLTVEGLLLLSAEALAALPSASGVPTFLHTQAAPASVWTINHNMGLAPKSVSITTLGGANVGASWVHTSPNQLQVNLNAPMAGLAYII